jgi:hypothetical protein
MKLSHTYPKLESFTIYREGRYDMTPHACTEMYNYGGQVVIPFSSHVDHRRWIPGKTGRDNSSIMLSKHINEGHFLP